MNIQNRSSDGRQVGEYRLGGKININLTPLILAQVDGFNRPLKFGEHDINKIGIVRNSKTSNIDGVIIYINDNQYIYNVVENNQIVDSYIFNESFQHTPASREEWDEWIGSAGHIGNISFRITESDGSFEEFGRVFAPQIAGHINVDETIEMVTAIDGGKFERKHHCMIFGRYINETNTPEFLHLDVIDERDQAYINFSFGLKLDSGSVTVIY